MDTKAFSSELLSALTKTGLFQQVSLSVEGPTVDGRAHISENRFLNYYFNERTGTMAFALIDNEKRIWGIDFDNLRGWHSHPIDKPEEHIAIESLTVAEIVTRLVEALTSQSG